MSNHDAFLWVISHRKQLNWSDAKLIRANLHSRFTPTATEQQETEDSLSATDFHIEMRITESLGHLDADFKRRKLFCSAPYIAPLPGYSRQEVIKGILCGARCENFVNKTTKWAEKNGGSVCVQPQGVTRRGYFVPDRVEVEIPAGCNLELLEIASSAPAYYAIFDSYVLDPVLEDDLEESIVWPSGEPLPLAWKAQEELEFYGWKCQELSVEVKTLGIWSSAKPLHLISEPYSLREYIDPITTQRKSVLWQRQQNGSWFGSEVDRDWGRYELLRRLAEASEDLALVQLIRHSGTEGILLIPRYLPLPRQLARAVTLCSGWAPKSVLLSEVPYLAYRDVPQYIAHAVIRRLGQDLQRLPLHIANQLQEV